VVNCSSPNVSGTYDTSNGAKNQAGCWQYNHEKNILEGADVTWDVLNDAAQNTWGLLEALTNAFGTYFSGDFSWSETGILTQAIAGTARAFGLLAGDIYSGQKVFKAVFQGTNVRRMSGPTAPGTGGGGLTLPGHIYLWGGGITVGGVAHELGYAYDFMATGYFHTYDTWLSANGLDDFYIDNTSVGYSAKYGYSQDFTHWALMVYPQLCGPGDDLCQEQRRSRTTQARAC